jgi:hypothetical protein
MIEDQVKDLVAVVRDNLTGAPKVSGTIYVVIRFELEGHADDGKFWDSTAGGSWQASPAAWPTATYLLGGLHGYAMTAAMTTGKTSADKASRIAWRMTDNVATPASETASSALIEEPIYAADAFNPASDTTEVRGFTTAGKAEIEAEAVDALQSRGVTTTVTGRLDAAVSSRLASADYSAPPTAASIADAVLDEAMAGHTSAGSLGAAITQTQEVVEGDRVLDKTTDPTQWKVQTYRKGTNTALIAAKNLKDHANTAVAATSQAIASMVQP